MDENLKKQLKIFACKARIGAIDGIYCAKAVDMRSAFISL